jgi:transglutaminase-like putative cysteine protease
MEKLHTPQSRWWDWAAIGLLLLLLHTLASRLLATSWTPFLNLIQTFTSLAFIVGAALGYSRFHRSTVRWLTFFYMLLLLPLMWTLVIDQDTSLEEQLLSVGGRLFYSTSDFLARRPVEDPLFFVAIMSIAFWIISSWSGFTLVRNQNYLGAVLPSAIGLLIIQNYDNVNTSRLWFLAFFAFVALLLLGRLQFLQNKLSWLQRRVFVSPDNHVDLTSSMAIAAGLIIIVAWTAPASLSSLESAAKTWNKLTRPWQEFTDRMENAVSALESKVNTRRGEFFSTELMLGRGFPLSDNMMFQVQVPTPPEDQKPPRYYWRGRVYDHFVKDQWYTTGTTRQDFSASEGSLPVADTQTSTLERFLFSVGPSRTSLLYGPSQPVWFSRSGSILTSPADGVNDIVSWSASPSLLPGETYQMDAVLRNPTIEQLRTAGTEYPEWVANKYLQLPQDFSPKIKNLAAEITVGAETPYDKAVAITNYLRQNIEYADQLPATPARKDTLEWILFEYKKAYCVYYATSEILMLRSLGIPARMAVGFSQGAVLRDRENLIEENNAPSRFLVREKNAHAWPEVYFPGIGWVEFEPTGNQAPLDRPVERQNTDNGNLLNPANQQLLQEPLLPERDPSLEAPAMPVEQASRFLPLLYLLPLLAVAAGLTIFFGRRYELSPRVPVFLRGFIERTGIEVPAWVLRWEKWVKLSPIEKAFESINFGLRQLQQPVPVHVTPIERAEKLARILPAKADQIKILLDEHQTSLYTSRDADVTLARQAASDIRKQVIIERIRGVLAPFYGKPLR